MIFKTRTGLIGLSLAALLVVTGPALVGVLAEDGAGVVCYEDAEIFIELNATDEDVGIQVFLDGEPWRKVKCFNPNRRRIFSTWAKSVVKTQGFSEFFFESGEPSFEEVPLDEFLARFPEGVYRFEGRTTDYVEIVGEAMLTHVLPAGPVIVSPVSENEEPPVVDPADFVIEWEPVTETYDGSGEVEIVSYELIVEQDEPSRSLKVLLPATRTSFHVPEDFFEQRGALHKFEVIAKEESGNQTITEGEFVTAE